MTMRPVYAKFEERHHRILKQRAREEGCTISDLLRRATIQVFDLPTDSEEIASTGKFPTTNGHGEDLVKAYPGPVEEPGASDQVPVRNGS